MITADQIKRVCPNARADIVAAIVTNWPLAVAIGINTPLRTQHFFAQAAVESAGLTRLEENLNYSAKRLVQVWPKRFPTIAAATPYAGNPAKLAEKVYGGRLGNTKPGDGYLYRGGGIFQNTGKDNYTLAGHAADPDTLRTPVGGFKAALKFWADNNLNAIADRDDVTELRRRVNGGTNGLDDCKAYLALAKKAFATIAPDPVAAVPQPVVTPPPAPVAIPAPPDIEPIPAAPTAPTPTIGWFARLWDSLLQFFGIRA